LFIQFVVSIAYASDPDALQDLCVAFPSSSVKMNGFACKEEANVTEADFFFAGLANPGVINNATGSVVTAANTSNPPHTHPRATEILFVLEGELDVGFITTANKLISKTVKEGEVFVFPKALVHFQKNNGDKPAAVISAFDSQLPGTFSIVAVLFNSTPSVPDDVLTHAFQIDTQDVDKIKNSLS
ncbi:hypothetical protein GLYMA_19G222800v4, partial [Glycine max]|uniref:Germin-like protein n=1 Tax=Glycine max TaxID=3847 RepID=K7MZP2_SOYBN